MSENASRSTDLRRDPVSFDASTRAAQPPLAARPSPTARSFLACPACRSALNAEQVLNAGQTLSGAQAPLACANPACRLHQRPFDCIDGRPVLIDFSRSILVRDQVVGSGGASVVEREETWRSAVFRFLDGDNPVAPHYGRRLVTELHALAKRRNRRARVLIIGGGRLSAGARQLYRSSRVDVVAFDIYASPRVSFLADAHQIPALDASFDAVWIQAVLEHVVQPEVVVDEIRRVLGPGGLVFADTPFLWPVHERAYDFTRYTASGHRWQFRRFELIAAGTSSGPGTVLVLAIRHFGAALSRSSVIGRILSVPFFWLRFLDRFCEPRKRLDSAGGLFFFGSRRPAAISPRELVSFYDDQPRLERAAAAEIAGTSRSTQRRQS